MESQHPPCLADRRGWWWLIGVPEGRNSYWDMYNYAISGADPEWDAFAGVRRYPEGGKEVESARRTLGGNVRAGIPSYF